MPAKRLILLAAGLLLAALIWKAGSSRQQDPARDAAPVNPPAERSPSGSKSSAQTVALDAKPADEPQMRMQQAAAALPSSSSAASARAILQDLRAYLTSLPPDTAQRALRSYLDTRADAPTKLEFVIGPDGKLKEAPALRVWLLDCLGEIDRNAAADYARSILAAPASADEWAVSLRDFALARNAPADVAFVQGKARELIHHAAWQRNPSAGFLEAFDVIVHTKATALTPDLAQLVSRKDNRALAHAAYLTLDRLVIERPQEVLSQIAANPGMMQGREQTRANYFARADVRDAEQRRLVENYLLDSRRSPQELQTFAGIYPSANYMISTNLLTKTETPPHAELAARDRASLKVVEDWLADPRFAPVQPQLQQIHARLKMFVEQAGADQGAPR